MRSNLKKHLLAGASCVALTLATPALAAPPAPVPVYNWSGWYAGGNVGYSWGRGAVIYNEPAFGGFVPTSFSGPNNLDGAIGGAQVGYNWQLNDAWVAGLEADLQLADEKASNSFSFPYSTDCEGGGCALSGSLSSKIEWFGTVRGRVGWLYNPTTMVYATGGLAYGRVVVSGSFADNGCTPTCVWGFNQAATNFGWTLGGGIEGAVLNSPNWTWKIEYLYIDLGSISGSGFDNDFGGPFYYNANFTDNILRFGMNWHFH